MLLTKYLKHFYVQFMKEYISILLRYQQRYILMQLPQFFDLLKTLDHLDPSNLQNLVIQIKKILYSYWNDISKLAPALYKTAEQIMKTKDVKNQCVPYYEDLICEIIRITIHSQFAVGVDALRIVFNLMSQYYKGSNLDTSLTFPIGKDRPLKQYLPKVGQQCDVVRPYITSNSECGWTRCKVVDIQNGKYTIKYANVKDQPSTRQKPWFAPLGSRTVDYDWRMSLDIGSPIQALLNRVWYKATVAEISEQNQCKKVRVTFRRFAQDGDKVDTFGIRYFGLSSGQDQWMDVLSPRIQKCDKMVNKKLCYYSFNAQQAITEDLYDIIFEQQFKQKPFYAIARSLNCKSLSLLKYISLFVELNGIQKVLKLMQNLDFTDDRPFLSVSLLGIIVQHLPRMYLKESGIQNAFLKMPSYYQAMAKHMTVLKIDCCYYAMDMIGRRMFSLTEMHQYENESRKILIKEFLRMNMEKQMLALRYLNQLVSPKKPYTQNQKKVFDKFLKDQHIFSQLFNANTHEQIIARGGYILQYMIKNEIIDQKQFQTLWTIVPVTDTRGRATIEKLLAQITKNLPINFVQALTTKFLSLKQTELTLDNLNLLRLLKNREISNELQMNLLTYLWDVMTVKSVNIKTVIEQEVEKVFKSFVSTLKDHKIRMNVLQSMCTKLNECKKVKNQIEFLKDFIKSFSQVKEVNSTEITEMVEENEVKPPETMFEAVSFLKSKGIYSALLNLLFSSKDESVKKDIFQFISFLFEYDNQDTNQIIRKIYEKIGPSPNFLEWVNKLLPRSTQFAIQLLQKTTDFSVYEQINSPGYLAIEGMIIDVNAEKKNIKIITTYHYKNDTNTNTVAVGPSLPGPVVPTAPLGPVTGDAGNACNNEGNKENKFIGPQLPPETCRNIYVLVSPFKLIGMRFLENLLPTVKQTSVYNSIVQTIVGLVTSLDQSIESKTQQYRKEFLYGIMSQIRSIIKQNKIDDKIKSRLQIYVFVISEILAKTQQNGIGSIEPYFTKVEGEKLTLIVQNLFQKQKDKKYKDPLPKFEVECSENATLWKLKQLVGKFVNQPANNVDIIKYTDPIKGINNSKSLIQLIFYNNQKIKVARRPPRFIPKGALLNNQGTDLSEKFQKVVQEYFDQYKNSRVDGLKKEDLDRLCTQKWRGSLFRDRAVLQNLYEQYDKQKKGYLVYNDFRKFFFEKSVKSFNGVWRLINLSGYLNNFKKQKTEDQPDEVKVETLPRKILSNPQIYSLIFEILQNQTFKDVHLNFYKLLCCLEVDQSETEELEHKIFEIIEKQKSAYALCYSLEVITSELAKKQNFYFEFWKRDGIKAIEKRITELLKQKPTIYELDLLMKNQIIPGFIRILNMYTSQLLWTNKLVRFANQNKINYLEINQFASKINDIKCEYEDPNLQTEASKKLRELGSVEQNLKIIYQIASLTFDHLIKGYVNDKVDYLSKLTFEIIRLLGSLISTKYNQFQPKDYLYGIKNLSLSNRRSISLFIFIYLFYSQSQNNGEIEQVIQKLLQDIPSENKVENYNFFQLLKQITAKYLQMFKQNTLKDQFFINIGNQLLNKLFLDVVPEERCQQISNKVISGILFTVEALMEKQSVCRGLSWRVIQITQKCLFAYKIEQKLGQLQVNEEMLTTQKQKQHFKNYVICKTEPNRAIAYNIVSKMHKISPAIQPMFIDNYILPIIKSIKNEVRICAEKSYRVGLKNFGSTCYMNSMLQVLNSIGPFRNSLMKCQSEVPLIVELKRLFAGLFYSQKIDYAPVNLLNAFVPPINPGIQQDTTQFLNLLFDQLQAGLSQTSYKRLLDQIFKGANTVQMICHSCGYKKQNRQQFFCFGVQIDGKYDLQSALEGSYQGQSISDYLCDSCQNRGQTTKRNVLSEIPNVLFIHLRRIVFNYDMFVNMKIHTRLQFPEQLNIQPYTKEGVELRQKLGLEYMKNLSHNQQELKKFQILAQHEKQKDFYKLKLKGVIVHSGSADVGHYYSILPDDKNWRKFDDSRVTFFANSGFESQCYGGTFTSQQWGSGSSGNAYVLIYEKQVKNPIKIQLEMDGPSQIKYNQIKVYNSPQDYGYFWLDNHYFMLQTHLLNQNNAKAFIKFVIDILNDCPSEVNRIQIVSEIVYRLSFHSGIVGDLLKIIKDNSNSIKPSLFYWFICAEKVRTFKLLFNHEKPVRQFMANYIHLGLIQAFKNGDQKMKTDVVNYILELLNSMTGEVAKNWLRADGYFLLLWLLVSSSVNIPELWNLFFERRFISTLIDYVMEKQSPVRINPKNYSLGTKTNPMDFSSGISIISFYLKHSYGFTGKNYQIPNIPEYLLFHLNDNDVICLSYMQFYKKMLRERQNLYQLAAIIQRLCIMNLQFSRSIIEAVLEAINTITDPKDEMEDYSHICLEILKIRDDYWTERAQFLLGVGSPCILNNNLMSSLDEQRYAFTSTLYDVFPVECLLSYTYLYRLKNTTGCFYLVRALIQGCSVSDIAMKYLARQPSPSYLYDSYVSWAENFITSFIPYVTTDPKVVERLQRDVSNLMKYVQDLKQFKKDNPEIDYYKSVITGQTFNKKQIKSFEKDGIQVKIFQYETECLPSKTVASGGNTAMDPHLQYYRLTKQVTKDSNILKFIKKPIKAITLKMQTNEEQDKQISQLMKKQVTPTQNSTQIQTQNNQPQSQSQPGKQQSKSQPQTEIKEEQIIQQEVNLQGIFLNKYYRQIQATNKSKDKKYLTISFFTEQNPNFLIPKQLSWKLFPKNSDSIWISKQDASKDWSNLEQKLIVEDYVKQKHEKKLITTWWFKKYGQKDNNNEVTELQEQYTQIVPLKEEPQQEGPKVDMARDIDMSQVNCPICTFFNPISNQSCDACGSPLN